MNNTILCKECGKETEDSGVMLCPECYCPKTEVKGPFRRFRLIRKVDVTGISGTGEIAIGVEWPDHSCALFWLNHGTVGIYASISKLEEIHCYNNNARIVWNGMIKE